MPTISLISKMGCVTVGIISKLLSCNFAWRNEGKVDFKLKGEAKANFELRGRYIILVPFRNLSYAYGFMTWRVGSYMHYPFRWPFNFLKGVMFKRPICLLDWCDAMQVGLSLQNWKMNFKTSILPIGHSLGFILAAILPWERGILLVLGSDIYAVFLMMTVFCIHWRESC